MALPRGGIGRYGAGGRMGMPPGSGAGLAPIQEQYGDYGIKGGIGIRAMRGKTLGVNHLQPSGAFPPSPGFGIQTELTPEISDRQARLDRRGGQSLPKMSGGLSGYQQGAWKGFGNYHQNMRDRSQQIDSGNLNAGGLNGYSWGGHPPQGQYMQDQRKLASDIASGGTAPPYRASQQDLTSSQRRLVAARGLPPTEPGGTPQNPGTGVNLGPPQATITQNNRGQEVFGLPGYNNGFGGPAKFFSGSKTPSGTIARGQGGTGLALQRDAKLANAPDFVNGEQYVKAREQKQADKDRSLIANVQRRGLPASLAARAMERQAIPRQQKQLQAARDAHLAEMEMVAHTEHMRTLKPQDRIKYIQGLRQQAGVASKGVDQIAPEKPPSLISTLERAMNRGKPQKAVPLFPGRFGGY